MISMGCTVAAGKIENTSIGSVLVATFVGVLVAAIVAEVGEAEAGHLVKENLKYFVAKKVWNLIFLSVPHYDHQ